MEIIHQGKKYTLSDEEPKNGDLVSTENCGVWEFRDDTGYGSAPLLYWSNKNTCKKMVLIETKPTEIIFTKNKKAFNGIYNQQLRGVVFWREKGKDKVEIKICNGYETVLIPIIKALPD